MNDGCCRRPSITVCRQTMLTTCGLSMSSAARCTSILSVCRDLHTSGTVSSPRCWTIHLMPSSQIICVLPTFSERSAVRPAAAGACRSAAVLRRSPPCISRSREQLRYSCELPDIMRFVPERQWRVERLRSRRHHSSTRAAMRYARENGGPIPGRSLVWYGRHRGAPGVSSAATTGNTETRESVLPSDPTRIAR